MLTDLAMEDTDYCATPNTGIFLTIQQRYCCFCWVVTSPENGIANDACSLSSSEDEVRKESVNLDTWLKRKDVFASFECHEIVAHGHMVRSYILIMEVHMYVLREISKRPGWAHIQHRHHLADVLKITSKRKHPEIITFKYGSGNMEESEIKSSERYLIPNSQKATKKIKERILKVLGE